MTFYLFVSIFGPWQLISYTVGLFAPQQLHRTTMGFVAYRPFSVLSHRPGVLCRGFESCFQHGKSYDFPSFPMI